MTPFTPENVTDMLTNSMFGTTEMEAWLRDFVYDDYVKLANTIGTKLWSRTAYKCFCMAFDAQMENDYSEWETTGFPEGFDE